jgi:mono/diheme cytochrome c family protein
MIAAMCLSACRWIAFAVVFAQAGATGPAVAATTRGETLAGQWCAACHAIKAGQTSPNPKAPAFPAIAAEPSATEYSLRVFLRTTHATMPNFTINPDDIDDLVDYIRSLKAKP